MSRLPGQTKVSDYGTGSTSPLSTLFSLNADLCNLTAQCSEYNPYRPA
jgi:hypothetical protein